MGCWQRDCIIYLDPARRMHQPGIKRCRCSRLGRPAGCPRAAPILSQMAERGPGSVLGAPGPERGDVFIRTWAAPAASPRIRPCRGLLSNQILPGRAEPPSLLPAALGSCSGINIPAQVLLRGLLPASPPPAPPGRVVLGWRDDNRKCICRLPSNFLMGASWTRASCAVSLRSAPGDLEGDNHELLSGKTKKWKNLSGPAALSHCISREPCVCGPNSVPEGLFSVSSEALYPTPYSRDPRVLFPPHPSPNHFHLLVKRCDSCRGSELGSQ